MSKRFPLVISWVCIVVMATVPMAGLWLLVDLATFKELAVRNFGLPIIWSTVEHWQWLVQWLLTALYSSIGLFGLYYLYRAFSSFAQGEWFTRANSLNLRRFSLLLIVQVVAKPLYVVLSSVLLSVNHPAGEKMLAVFFGSDEVQMLVMAMILWVVSDLLIAGGKLQAENRQFV